MAVELGELVKKKHTQMRQRNFPGLRWIAPADQRRGARRMMRGAKRPSTPLRGREAGPAGGQQGGRGERFVVGHRRQQAREAGGEHRFARTGRAHQQGRGAK
jgi:hypothetical protein